MTSFRLAVLFCAALLMIGCTAVTPEPRSDVAKAAGDVASAPAVPAAAEEDPVVCESIVRTGTRVAQRRCMRRSDLDRQQRGGQEALGEWQRRGTQVGNTNDD